MPPSPGPDNPPSMPPPKTPATLQLMEYLYLLPAILALTPLIAAYRLLQGAITEETLMYVFRLMSLSWLWMMTAVILYLWRPSDRIKHSFVLNVIKATCLGMLAMIPIVLSAAALPLVYEAETALFTTLEKLAAWLVLGTVGVFNLWFLKISFSQHGSVRRFSVWEVAAIALWISLVAMFLWILRAGSHW